MKHPVRDFSKRMTSLLITKQAEIQNEGLKLEDLVSPTGIWEFWVSRNHGNRTYGGLPTIQNGWSMFHSDPPVKWYLPPSQFPKPKVLIVGCKSETRELKDEKSPRYAGIEELCKKQGLLEPEVVTAPSTSMFWMRFFGGNRYLETLEENRLPSLIIATGNIRDYNEHGGATAWVKERLQEIADNWLVPIEFIKPFSL